MGDKNVTAQDLLIAISFNLETSKPIIVAVERDRDENGEVVSLTVQTRRGNRFKIFAELEAAQEG